MTNDKLLDSPAARWIVGQSHLNDPVSAVELEARRLLRNYNVNTPPVIVEDIAARRKMKIAKSVEIESSALLIPEDEGFLTKTRRGLSHQQYRFTVAHEIAHTLFYDLTASPPKKYYPSYLTDAGEEFLCDVGAAEILMPQFLFEPKLKDFGISIDSIFLMAELFQTSLQATILRIVRFVNDIVVIIWSNIEVPGKGKRLRVKWSAGPDHLFIPVHASNENGTMNIISSAYQSEDKIIRGFEKFQRTGSLRGEYYIEALRRKDIFSEDDYCVLTLIDLKKTGADSLL